MIACRITSGCRSAARALVIALAIVLLVAGTLVAQRERVSSRRVGVNWQAGAPRISFSARDLVTRTVREKLASGLPQNIVVRVYAYDESSGRALTILPLGCRVAFDLWEESYRVEVQTAAGDEVHAETNADDVLARCLTLRGVEVGEASTYATGARVYFAVIAELNPLSPDTVRRIRRWLTRPEAGGGQQDAFFGSFVSLFVNRRIGAAERTVRFRSQAVVVP